MRFPGLSRKRSSTLVLLLGQLVLIAYVFQVGAFDHWYHDVSHADMTPIERAVHAAHCHGDSAGCADSGGGIAVLQPGDVVRLPAPPSLFSVNTLPPFAIPTDAPARLLPQPPRQAA
jgi:hypothetical protein